MSDLSIIGIDGRFAHQENIDRFERALFLGNIQIKATEQSLKVVDLALTSALNLASANGLDGAEISVILVSNNHINFIDAEAKFAEQFSSCDIVESLSSALLKANAVSQNNKPVAIIGINQASKDATENNETKATIAFDESFQGYHQSTGIASLLISSTDYAKENDAYIYAQIKAFERCEVTGNDIDSDISHTTERALKNAQLNATDISLLEVSALDNKMLSNIESTGLARAYQATVPANVNSVTALSCARSVTGEGFAFSEVAGLLKTVISLHQQYIPGINDWSGPSSETLDAWKTSSIYFPNKARPWFPNSNNSLHSAAYSCMTENSYCHLILQESPATINEPRLNGYFSCSNLSLILLGFNDKNEFQNKLDELELQTSKVSNTTVEQSVSALAKIYYGEFNASSNYCVSLIAESKEELEKEIKLAKIGVIKCLEQQSEWKTPKGSYFTAEPVNTESVTNENIAFFYPGIGATYLGLGGDLFHLFPEIYQPVAALADDIGSSLKDTLLYPRCLSALSFKDVKQLDSELRNSLANIAECGVAFACVFTKIFEEVFDVHANYSAGYSMGEVSMYAALGCWQQPGLMSARLAGSETFNQRLSGNLSTLRTAWNITEPASQANNEKIWETYSIRATLEEVKQASKDEDRVFCTIINTPDNLLIGGYPEACERVIKNLGVRSMAMDMPNAIHSAPAHAEYDDMAALFTMDVTDRIDTKMFSSSCYLPIPQRSKAIANSIAKCLCDPVDFPRLVNSLYDKGARVFIEMGPGRSLCSWADKILKHQGHKAHASVPVNAKGTSDELTYIRALAKLVSHGVKVNLDTVYNGSIVVHKQLVKNDEK